MKFVLIRLITYTGIVPVPRRDIRRRPFGGDRP
jgi:hypothetical protein